MEIVKLLLVYFVLIFSVLGYFHYMMKLSKYKLQNTEKTNTIEYKNTLKKIRIRYYFSLAFLIFVVIMYVLIFFFSQYLSVV